MALTVETGEGLAAADAYVSAADFAVWVADYYGTTLPESDVVERAIRKATAYVDARYRGRFPGCRRRQRGQALEWPRVDAVDAEGWILPFGEVPAEIVRATCEGAYREALELGTLSPDLDRGGAISRLKAGSVEIEYAGTAPATTVFQDIDHAVARLLRPASVMFGTAVRC